MILNSETRTQSLLNLFSTSLSTLANATRLCFFQRWENETFCSISKVFVLVLETMKICCQLVFFTISWLSLVSEACSWNFLKHFRLTVSRFWSRNKSEALQVKLLKASPLLYECGGCRINYTKWLLLEVESGTIRCNTVLVKPSKCMNRTIKVFVLARFHAASRVQRRRSWFTRRV